MENGLAKASLKDGTALYMKEILLMVFRKVVGQKGTQIMIMLILLIPKATQEMNMMKSLMNEKISLLFVAKKSYSLSI